MRAGLAEMGERDGTSDAVTRALAFLYGKQRDDGGWGDPGARILFSPTAHTSHALLLGGLDARAGGERVVAPA